jgi:hypothetical protein
MTRWSKPDCRMLQLDRLARASPLALQDEMAEA